MRFDRNLFVVTTIAITLILGLWWLNPSDENLIREKLNTISSSLNFTAKESFLIRAQRANAGSKVFFDNDIFVDIKIKYRANKILFDRDELAQYSTSLIRLLKTLVFRFEDVSIELADKKALVKTVGYMFINDNSTPTLSHLSFNFEKDEDGDWKIRKAISKNEIEL